jgi:class 3 adenylate cyclase
VSTEFDDETEDLVAAGLYDPAASDARPRRELLDYLLKLGLSIPELVQADEEGRLLSVAALQELRAGGRRLTLAAAASEAGIDETFALRLWRAFGFPDARAFERRFTDGDVATFALAGAMCTFVPVDDVLQLMRTVGGCAAQIAEAEIALLRSRVEAPRAETNEYVDIARIYVDAVHNLIPAMMTTIDTLHRHNLDSIARRYTDAGTRPSATNTAMLAVGFADLAGYTGLSQELGTHELGALVGRFEAVTGDVIAAAGAQVIKRIGDAVMFVTTAPGVGCSLALDLLAACSASGLPKLRIGLAFGEVIVWQGDCYGPTVNLAARLVAAAEPGVVLTDVTLRDRLANVVERFSFSPAGRYTLAGFDAPVETFQLLRA